MKKSNQAISIQFLFIFFAFMVPVLQAQTFVVTETNDPAPDGCNSGTDCSLREAIIAANDVSSGTAVIQLQGGQTYTLSRVNSDTSTDLDATTADEESGSLKILNNDAGVRIEAAGSGKATIDAHDIDRVFILYEDTDVEINEVDLAENPRVYKGNVDIIDIGANEFQGNVAPPSSCPATDGILFVKKGESGTGASWDDALGELLDALRLLDTPVSTGECTLEEVNEIWVAAGTYFPTADNSERIAIFVIPDGVNLIGGFEGVSSETSKEGRDWLTHKTILSGDIDEDGESAGNSYTVTAAFGLTNETVLDGFYVTGGNADGSGNTGSYGGGLFSQSSLLTVRNVVFENNFAQNKGGGAYVLDSEGQPLFMNVTFTNNESGDRGGGLATDDSTPNIEESLFIGNTSDWGGGADFSGSVADVEEFILITNTEFSENTGNTSGGAVSTYQGVVSIINSIISGNESQGENGGGGGIINEGSHLILRNVLVSGNSSDGYGGGIEFADTESSFIINSTITGNQSQKFGGGVQIVNSSPTVQNSIVWNNDSIDEDFARADNFSKGTGTPDISYSLIEGCNPAGTWDAACGTDSGNNLSDTDPLFDTAINPGDSPTTNGDFSQISASPVINIGSNTLYTNSGGDTNNDDDLAGEDRLFDGNTDVIDLGAYEFQGEPADPGVCPANSNILYVKKGENGSGASWPDALGELRDALMLFQDETCSSDDIDEIWVAKGIYLPTDEDTNLEATFQLVNQISVYGGFEGDENNLEDRDWETNLTILSGDIDGNDDLFEPDVDSDSDSGTPTQVDHINGGNSFHVTTGSGTENSAILDGFTITGGLAESPKNAFQWGAGMYNDNGSPTLANIVFSGNSAIHGGSGMYNINGSDPILMRVTFKGNNTGDGAGMYNAANSNPSLTDVIFIGNYAFSNGGGMYNEDEISPILTNVIFTGNSAEAGGGMFSHESNPVLTNVAFISNSATEGGGMYNRLNNSPILTNVTFTGNNATEGGAMFNNSGSTPDVTNVIIWDNQADGSSTTASASIFNNSSIPVISHSLVANSGGSESWDSNIGTESGNNLDVDPLFVNAADPEGADDVFGTADDGLALQSTSPAINMGNNARYRSGGVAEGITIDLAGNDRIFNDDTVDMGAYEFQSNPEEPGLNTPTLSGPADETADVDRPVTLVWNAVDDATSYQIQVVEESGSFDTPDFDDETTNTEIEVTGLASSTEYKWRVRSLTSEDQSEWSQVWTFTTAAEELDLDAPTLSSPADEATGIDRPVTLAWNSVSDADSYSIQAVEESGSFTTPDFDDSASDTDIEVTGLNPSTEYKWRVRAVAGENESEWSEVWAFTTSAEEEDLGIPQLASPSDEATDVDLTVMLDWDAASGAESYQAQLVTESGAFDTPDFDDETSDTDIEVTGLAASTEYKWRVRSLTTVEESEWSEVRTFTTMGLPEGEDRRILVSNASEYEFSKSDFGISNDNFSVKIETLPDEGTLLFENNPVNLDDEISIENINSDDLTLKMPDDEYGYNFTSFGFRILDDNANQSENLYTLTIDLGASTVELSGSEGWRFMSNPSGGDSYFDLFSDITVKTGPPPSQTLYELDQENYEWEPIESTGDEPGVGTPFIVYLLEDDLPAMVESGDNWDDLDGSYSFSGLDYDPDGTSPNPGNFYLLGNPHPIALDFCQFTDENIATSAYFWNPEANGGHGDYISLNCAAPGDVHIAPFQSFWVRTTEPVPELEIPVEAYMEDTAEGYFKDVERSAMSPKDIADLEEGTEQPSERLGRSEGFVITLNVTGEQGLFTNRTQILFTEEAEEGLDRFDAPKLSAAGLAQRYLSFYSLGVDNLPSDASAQGGQPYALQALPMTPDETIRIPLDIQTTESGRFTLYWTLPEPTVFNGSYFLKDNNTGEVMELREGASYQFEMEPAQPSKVSDEERSAKSPKDFADLGKALIQPKETETTHPMSELSGPGVTALNTHRMNSEDTPRFELLITTAGIDGLTELGAVPEEFTLAQNYPNPFNPTTVIRYQLPVSSQVRLEVYDMLGRNVATLVNEQVAAGRHTVNFDASRLSSGVYLYRLQAGSQLMTRKLTILK